MNHHSTLSAQEANQHPAGSRFACADLFGVPIVEQDDIVLTPEPVAQAIVERFKPSGRILDPCKGDGAFLKFMAGADWCEAREGRNFYDWTTPVDWIVSNPPYSIFSDFLRHSFTVADNIVYLIPVNKAFNSYQMMLDVAEFGGIETIFTIGYGRSPLLGFPIGFCCGAVHYKKGYTGGTKIEFYSPNAKALSSERSGD
jgi:hypothetical protein